MNCPTCGVPGIISAAGYRMNGEDLQRHLVFQCRNRQCPKNGKTIGEKFVPLELERDE